MIQKKQSEGKAMNHSFSIKLLIKDLKADFGSKIHP